MKNRAPLNNGKELSHQTHDLYSVQNIRDKRENLILFLNLKYCKIFQKTGDKNIGKELPVFPLLYNPFIISVLLCAGFNSYNRTNMHFCTMFSSRNIIAYVFHFIVILIYTFNCCKLSSTLHA